MTMTKDDILREIQDVLWEEYLSGYYEDEEDKEYLHTEKVAEYLYEEIDWNSKTLETKSLKIELEESWGGEGEGDQYGYVFSARDKTGIDLTARFFRVDAYYASWDGVYWSDSVIYEVEPRMVQVRKWFAVK